MDRQRALPPQLFYLAPALASFFLGALVILNETIWFGAGLLFVSGLLTARAYRIAFSEFTQKRTQSRDTGQLDSVNIDPDLPAFLAERTLEAIYRPQRVFSRIKETVTPMTRAVHVTTEYTAKFVHPKTIEDTNGVFTVFVPISISRKGTLHDRMQVQMAGAELPTLTFQQSVEHIGSCFRAMVERRLPKSLKAYKLIEPEILGVLAERRTSPEILQKKSDTVSEKLNQTLPDSMERELIAGTLAKLADAYAIIAVVRLAESDEPSYIHITTEERVVLTHASGEGYANESSNIGLFLGAFASHLRRFYGIRTSRIDYPIDKSYGASSYHLEIMGPEGTYLGRHAFSPETNAKGLGYRRSRARRGQRFLHFYARQLEYVADSEAWRNQHGDKKFKPVVSAWFYERPPGSLAASAVTATVSFCLLLAASRTSHAEDSARSDVIALLLVVPGAIAGWAGFEGVSRSIAGTLAARVSASVTIAFSILGAMQYMLGTPENAIVHWIPAILAWQLIVAVSATNAAAMMYAWMKRARLYDQTLFKRGPDLEQSIDISDESAINKTLRRFKTSSKELA